MTNTCRSGHPTREQRIRFVLACIALACFISLLGPSRLVDACVALSRADAASEPEWDQIQHYTFQRHIEWLTGG